MPALKVGFTKFTAKQITIVNECVFWWHRLPVYTAYKDTFGIPAHVVSDGEWLIINRKVHGWSISWSTIWGTVPATNSSHTRWTPYIICADTLWRQRQHTSPKRRWCCQSIRRHMPKYLHIQQHRCDNLKSRSDPSRSVADGSKMSKLFVVLLSVFAECWDDMPEIQGHYFIRKFLAATSCRHVYLINVRNSADHCYTWLSSGVKGHTIFAG